ncbi:SpoIIIAH-like family protein [Bacillus sp. Marseille-P3661]|uniref:SpoIIIAH-like family protein n=1 Tax=Bacillus sp. Marseille-P3661 TaxID=1936234 RepID=UPI000C8470FA|nr:SpoIIIAH-like family protein [Bacillus sp. Marseille-P3661]
MLLKKQTVWLLTMLSLVIVLSVYYITSPNKPTDDYALMTNEQNVEEEESQTNMEGMEVSIEEMEESIETGMSADGMFTALRMAIDDQRAMEKEELQAIAASSDVTAEKRSEALDKMEELHALATKEAILETMILANDKFADALVKAEEDQVRVIVKAAESTQKDANDIMRLVRDELGEKRVAVEFQPVQ